MYAHYDALLLFRRSSVRSLLLLAYNLLSFQYWQQLNDFFIETETKGKYTLKEMIIYLYYLSYG